MSPADWRGRLRWRPPGVCREAERRDRPNLQDRAHGVAGAGRHVPPPAAQLPAHAAACRCCRRAPCRDAARLPSQSARLAAAAALHTLMPPLRPHATPADHLRLPRPRGDPGSPPLHLPRHLGAAPPGPSPSRLHFPPPHSNPHTPPSHAAPPNFPPRTRSAA